MPSVSAINPSDVTGMLEKEQKVSHLERISYGLGSMGWNLVFTIVSTYLLYFYTDVAGLAAGAIGTMLFVSRLLGGIADVATGTLIDMTNTRWGKSRPYLLWFAAPLAVLAVMTVFVPPFGQSGKLVYAYATYILFTLALTGVSVPLGVLVSSISGDPNERSAFSSMNAFLGISALLTVSACTIPLVRKLGAGNERIGFLLTTSLYASLALTCILFAFLNTRERVTSAQQDVVPFRTGLASIAKNEPWLIMMAAMIVFWTMFIMHTQTTVYYLRYNCNRPDLIPLVMATLVAALPGCRFVPWGTRRFGKRNTALVGCALIALGLGVIKVDGGGSVIPLMTGNIVYSFGKGIIIPLLLAMIADTVDYGEWKTGVRSPGIIFAGSSLATKAGLAIAGALSAWLLAEGHYVPDTTQTLSSLRAIDWSYVWAPLIVTCILAALLKTYSLDGKIVAIAAELEQRRKHNYAEEHTPNNT